MRGGGGREFTPGRGTQALLRLLQTRDSEIAALRGDAGLAGGPARPLRTPASVQVALAAVGGGGGVSQAPDAASGAAAAAVTPMAMPFALPRAPAVTPGARGGASAGGVASPTSPFSPSELLRARASQIAAERDVVRAFPASAGLSPRRDGVPSAPWSPVVDPPARGGGGARPSPRGGAALPGRQLGTRGRARAPPGAAGAPPVLQITLR